MKDCQEVAHELYTYLDRELAPGDLVEITQHLSRCSGCFELVRFESGVLRLVKRDCGSEMAPACLREKLVEIPRSVPQ